MFRFKQFAVRQDRCPMKVGTDGVLLGAWAEVRPGDRRMLDVGTGTGLIALMLAQRSAARITAVDVDAECATQAAENFAASPWADRLDAVAVAVQRYDPVERFDLIGVKRCLMEFVRGDAAEFRTDRLVIEEAPGRFTEEYRRLTGDFYLKF